MSSLDQEMSDLMGRSEEVETQDEIIEVGLDGVEKRSTPTPAPAKDAPTADDPEAKAAREPETLEEIRERYENLKIANREARTRAREAERRAERARSEFENAQRNWETLMTRFMAGQGPNPGSAPVAGQPQTYQQTPQRPDPSQIDLSQLDVENAPIDVLKAAVAKIQAYEYERAQEAERVRRERDQEELGRRQQAQQVETIRTIANSLREDEADFRIEEPAYDEAADFFVKTRESALKAAFPAASEQQIKQAVLDEILQATYQAVQSGRSPAQLIFEASKSYGWSRGRAAPGAGGQAAAAAAPAAAPGARAPAAAPAQPASPVDPADPLAHIRKGQAAARSAGAGGAGPASSDLSLKDVLSLKGAAFSSASEKLLKNMRGR